jgi:hypothetical protein
MLLGALLGHVEGAESRYVPYLPCLSSQLRHSLSFVKP